MAWFLYVAKCRDGSLYTGVAIEPEVRLRRHNSGEGSKYVRSRAPAVLVYTRRCGSRSAALRLERRMKSLTRSAKLAFIGAACAS
jgi:putative endonuclease